MRNKPRKIIGLATVVVVLVLAAGCIGFGVPTPKQVTEFAPLNFRTPKIASITLSNGMTVLMLEDHELPIVQVSVRVRTGSIYEPAEKLGLASLTGTVMRSGGTREMTGDKLDEELEFTATGLETSIGRESGTANMSVLKKNLRRGFELLAEVLCEPTFSKDKFELARRNMIEGIRRRYDEPTSIADVEFPKLVYGASSPWARTSTVETVNAVTRADLVAFHHKYFVPNNTMMAVSGDFDKKAMRRLLEDVFGGWHRRTVTFPNVPPIAERYEPGAYWVQRDGAPQTVVVTGHLGMRRHCPEQIAVETMNNIFGLGGFTSRLMREVRSNRGLAYSVYGYVSPGTDRGLFEVFCQTKAESTVETTRLIQQIVRQMTEKPVPVEELTATKEQLLNTFIFKFESAAALLNERLLRDYLGYAPDYLDTYTDKVRAVSAADVLDAARKYIHPDGMVSLFVGDKTLFGGNIDEFGPVREIKLDRDNGTSRIVQ